MVATAGRIWILADFPIGSADVPLLFCDVRHLGFCADLKSPLLESLLQSEYPPLTYLFTWLFDAVLGHDLHVAFLSITVVVALVAPAAYLLARSFLGPAAGWMAFLLTAASKALLVHSGRYLTDQMVALFVPLFLAAWFASQRMTRPWAVVLCGATLGLGLLAKFNFLFFTAVALFDAFLEVVRERLQGQHDSAALLASALNWGAAILLWTTILHGGGMLALVAGELSLALLIGGLGWRLRARRGVRARRLTFALVALSLALALAGPFYAAAAGQVAGCARAYGTWLGDRGLMSRPLEILEVPYIPQAIWLLPLGVAAILWFRRGWRREALVLMLQVTLGLVTLAGMCLGDRYMNCRFLLPAVPLLAVVGGGSVLWLRRGAALAPLLLLALLLGQYSPDEWVRLRRWKTLDPRDLLATGFPFPESPEVQLFVRHLQKDPGRVGLRRDVRFLCRSLHSFEQAMAEGVAWHAGDVPVLINYLGLASEQDDLHCAIELDRPWPGFSPCLPRPGFLLTATRSAGEEAALIRDGQAVLGVRLEKFEGASYRTGRLVLWRVFPRQGGAVGP